MVYKVKPPEVRFWKKVEKREDGCWLWKAKSQWFLADGVMVRAADFSFRAAGLGERPKYSKPLCQTAGCVQPRHWGFRPKAKPSPERIRQYREANRERFRDYRRAKYRSDPESHRAKARAWKAANPDKVTYRAQLERTKDPAKFKSKRISNDHVRRARLRGGAVEKVELLKLLERDCGLCQICGEAGNGDKWSIDHIVPISLGGEHTYANTRLAHMRCNAGRSNRHLT